jgi:hypothetical protein
MDERYGRETLSSFDEMAAQGVDALLAADDDCDEAR